MLNLLGIVDVPRLYITLPAAAATIALHRTRYDGLMILTTACALVVWVIVEFLNSLGVINIPNLVAAVIAFVIGGLVYYILGFLGRDAEKPGTELGSTSGIAKRMLH